MDSMQIIASRQLPVANEGRPATDHWQPTTGNSLRPRGFSFTEILFAVMILGIGFIMVAAMFPVGIQQTQANNQETITAAVGRASAEYLDRIAAAQVNLVMPPTMNYTGAQNPLMTSPLPPTFRVFPTLTGPLFTTVTVPGQVWSFDETSARDQYLIQTPSGQTITHGPYLWSTVIGNLVQSADPRFAWIPLYKRDIIFQGSPGGSATSTWAPYVQVIMIGIEAGSQPAFQTYRINPTDITDLQKPWVFQPELMKVRIQPGNINGTPTSVTFMSGNLNRIAEGSYLVVSDTQFDGSIPPNPRQLVLAGRVFRVGVAAAGSVNNSGWQLRPGDDLTPSDLAVLGAAPFTCDVYVIGRGVDPAYKGGKIPFKGPSQEISVYTTFLQVPN